MPVFKSGEALAPWCELEYFEIVKLSKGETHRFERKGKKEKLIVGNGKCRIKINGNAVEASEGSNLDLETPEGNFEVVETLEDAVLVHICGRWGDDRGGSGIFRVYYEDSPSTRGDPYDYFKNTNIDNHYHDCDEYYIILEGRGIVVSEGKSYEVGPGDCVATRAGDHHDFPQMFEPVKAVWFETTYVGQKRPGHLWEHTHGKAFPRSG